MKKEIKERQLKQIKEIALSYLVNNNFDHLVDKDLKVAESYFFATLVILTQNGEKLNEYTMEGKLR